MEILYRAVLSKKRDVNLDRENYEQIMKASGHEQGTDFSPDWEVGANLSHLKTLIDLNELQVDWTEESGTVQILLRIRTSGE